jgi:hypothetical protein
MVESTKEVTTRIDNEDEEGTTIEKRLSRQLKGKVGLECTLLQVRFGTGLQVIQDSGLNIPVQLKVVERAFHALSG